MSTGDGDLGMIIETLVSSLNEVGTTNLAPMGPLFIGDWSRFELRPFHTSQTYSNLKRTREGILHITDDVELMARAAIDRLVEMPAMERGKLVAVSAVANACRWYEFRVDSVTELLPRVSMQCRTIYEHRQRDFLGFNRAKHAVLEAAILATRLDFVPQQEVFDQFRHFETIVQKTGGEQEFAAFQMLQQFVLQSVRSITTKNSETFS
jgi:hypothetical protein